MDTATTHQETRGYGPELPTVPDDSDSDADTIPYDDSLYTDDFELQDAAHIEALDICWTRGAPDACHFLGHISMTSTTPEPDHRQEPLELYIVHPLTRWLEKPVEDPSAYVVVKCYASGQREMLIERELNVLTAEECRQNAQHASGQ